MPAPEPVSDTWGREEQASEKQGVASAAVPTEPSPAHTPLLPPTGAEKDGPVAASPATPPTETVPLPPEPFAEELPPDFWGDALEPPDTPRPQTAPDEPFGTAAATVAEPAHPSAPASSPAKPLAGGLESDPRFVLLTELFPGRISDWRSAEAPAGTAAEDVDNALEEPETVDLEEGLDADETD